MKSQLSLTSCEMEGSDLPWCNYAIDFIPIKEQLSKSFQTNIRNPNLACLFIVLWHILERRMFSIIELKSVQGWINIYGSPVITYKILGGNSYLTFYLCLRVRVNGFFSLAATFTDCKLPLLITFNIMISCLFKLHLHGFS